MKKEILATLILGLMLGSYSLLRYMALQFHGDSAIVVMSVCRKSFINVHVSFGLMIFKPLCWLAPALLPPTMALLQGFGLAFAALSLYLISKELMGKREALMLSAALLLHPGLHGLISFDLHPDAYALIFISLASYFLIIKDSIIGYLLGLIAFSFKETSAFPLMGLFLWRLASGRASERERNLGLAIITLMIVFFLVIFPRIGGSLSLLKYRWGGVLQNPFDEHKILFLIIELSSVPLALLSLYPESLLWAPSFANLMLTRANLHEKFSFGFQYPAFLTYELFLASAIIASKMLKERERALSSLLMLEWFVFLIFSPLAPVTHWKLYVEPFVSAKVIWAVGLGIAALIALYSYRSNNGKNVEKAIVVPSAIVLTLALLYLLPFYPSPTITTYRPINLATLSCYHSAISSFELVQNVMKRGVVFTNDGLSPLFGTRYAVRALLVPWEEIAWNPNKELKFIADGVKSFNLVLVYGIESSLDVPSFLIANYKELRFVKGVGEVCLGCSLNSLKDYGLSAGKRRVPSLYGDLRRFGITRETVLRGRFWADVNGTYQFAGAGIEYLKIDGKVLRPSGKKVLTPDFVWVSYLGSLKLKEGWHEVEVKVYPGWVRVYWKGPYSCWYVPVWGTRLSPKG